MIREGILMCLVSCFQANGLFLTDRCTEFNSNNVPPNLPLSVNNIYQGQLAVSGRTQDIMDKMDAVVTKVTDNTNARDWAVVMSSLVDVLDDGLTLHQDMLYATLEAGNKLYEGNHAFKEVTRCDDLASKLDSNSDVAPEKYFAVFSEALTKDLSCLKVQLFETYSLDLSTNPWACIVYDQDAINLVTNAARILYRVRNDAQRVFHNIADATLRYNTSELHDAFIDSFSEADIDAVKKLIPDFDDA